jgi:hypothetical protein
LPNAIRHNFHPNTAGISAVAARHAVDVLGLARADSSHCRLLPFTLHADHVNPKRRPVLVLENFIRRAAFMLEMAG